jgi:glycosyltransferase involved in cell wall biosynthesis
VRILIAHEAAVGGGGVESYLASVIPALVARGHAVAFLHHGPRGAQGPTRLQFDGVPHFSVQDDGFHQVLERLATWQPDVCFSHNMAPLDVDEALLDRWPVVKMMHGFFGTCISSHKAHAFPSVVPCTRTFGAPCVALYGPRRCGPLRPAQAMSSLRWNNRQHALLTRYSSIVVASRYMQREYTRHGVSPDRVITAPLFPTTSNEDGARPRPVTATVLFAGRMTDLKGPGLLVNAMAIAAKGSSRPLKLVMAGDGPERVRLIALARARGVDASFPGWVTGADLRGLFRGASVVAVPSLWPEPFGLVGLEAALHGVPAVAFDSGGVAEWLHDGISGRLVRERTAAALGKALAAVLGDADILRTMEHGALEVATRMTLPMHLQQLDAAFASARVRR